MHEILWVKTFDRDIEWQMGYPLQTRFRPSIPAFRQNINMYLYWCSKLFRTAYKEKLLEGQAYDIGSIYMNELNIEWLKWRLPYTHWMELLPVPDASVPENKVVVVKKPFRKQRVLGEVELPRAYATTVFRYVLRCMGCGV